MNREDWLHTALDQFIRPLFETHGYSVPAKVRIGVGWPSKSALAAKSRRIGEAWSEQCSGDASHEIILSPVLDEPTRVLDVLIHEVIHITVGTQAGHRKPFSVCAAKVGLDRPWTATTASPALKPVLLAWVEALGAYPHARLDKSAREEKKQTTRLLLLECQCGLKVRSTQKWIDEYGPAWPCPCGGRLVHGTETSKDDDETDDPE